MSFQTLLASAARTASQTTPQTGSINSQSDTGKTVTLVFDVSAVPGTDTVQLVVEHIDQAGRVIAAFTAAARVAVGTDIVILGEGQPVLTPASRPVECVIQHRSSWASTAAGLSTALGLRSRIR